MIIQRLTYDHYLAAHKKYVLPIGNIENPRRKDLLTKAQWKKLYGGDIILPFAQELPDGKTIADYPDKILEEVSDKKAQTMIDKSQAFMVALEENQTPALKLRGEG